MKHPERAFEWLSSLLLKVPWDDANKTFKDHTFEATKLATESLYNHLQMHIVPDTVMQRYAHVDSFYVLSSTLFQVSEGA